VRDPGFSWEWFEWEHDNIYRKLQVGGLVKAMTITGKEYEALASVEFMEDAIFRYNAEHSLSPGGHTHHMLIKQGSVFRFAP